MRWRELHGYGSRRSRGLSFGSAGRTVNVWRISLGRLREGTRAVTALAPKALDAKTKELIALGIGIARRSVESAPKADIRQGNRDVRFVSASR